MFSLMIILVGDCEIVHLINNNAPLNGVYVNLISNYAYIIPQQCVTALGLVNARL